MKLKLTLLINSFYTLKKITKAVETSFRQIKKVYENVADLGICCIFASVGRGHGVKNQWTIKT